jgi:hypothetical protein
MDIESENAIRLLEVLGDSNEKLAKLAHRLRANNEVLSVLRSLECYKSKAGSLIEGYVDVELRNGKAVCWYLEVSWDSDNWTIDARILINDERGQETAHKFTDRITNKFNEFLTNLAESIAELTNFEALQLLGIKL